MKTCCRCKQEKALTEFNRRGKGHQASCRECSKKYYREYYQNNPNEKQRLLSNNQSRRIKLYELIKEKKSVPCVDCKTEYPHYVMQFDHLRDKLFNIGDSRHRFSEKRILGEIEKCEVVCANCHAERTWNRQNDGG